MNYWLTIYRISRIVLGVLVVIAVIAIFVPQIRQYNELHRKEAMLQDEIRREDETARDLKHQQLRLEKDPRYVKKLAREELGYCKPGETVFRFVESGQNSEAR